VFFKNLMAVFIPAFLVSFLSLSLNTYTSIFSVNWYIGLSALFLFSFILNLIYASQAGSENFTQLLIVAIVIKLLLALSAIVWYSFIDKAGFFNFSIHFILMYVLFTIFEIRYVLYLLKKNPIHAKN
jgi:hypothetical protein